MKTKVEFNHEETAIVLAALDARLADLAYALNYGSCTTEGEEWMRQEHNKTLRVVKLIKSRFQEEL